MQTHPALNKVLFYLALGILLLAFAPYSVSWVERWMAVPALSFDEPWRFISGHFSHWSWHHWWVNCAALACFILLYFHSLSAANILAFSIFLLLGNGIFLGLFYSRDFYLGFSGLLYGWFVYAALWNFSERKLLNSLVLLFLLLRLLDAGREPAGLDGIAIASEVHWLNVGMALLALGLQRFFFKVFVKRLF